MKRAEQKYASNGLTVLWVGHQDRVEKLNKYAKNNGIEGYLFDPDEKMSMGFGMKYGGGMVFIDRNQTVKARAAKGVSPAKLEEELKKIL